MFFGFQNGLNATAHNRLMMCFKIILQIFALSGAGNQNIQMHAQQMANYMNDDQIK